LDEASEICVNYHWDRIFLKFFDGAVKNRMTEYADDISKGRLLERAAISKIDT
jgi:hypothetical protein